MAALGAADGVAAKKRRRWRSAWRILAAHRCSLTAIWRHHQRGGGSWPLMEGGGRNGENIGHEISKAAAYPAMAWRRHPAKISKISSARYRENRLKAARKYRKRRKRRL